MARYGKCWAVLGFAALLAGCAVKGESETPPGTHACSPLEPVEPTTSLRDVLVVARAADGTLYAVDTVDYSHRVFVSSGSELFRQHVSGEGEINDGASTTHLVTFERDETTYTIGIQTSEGSSSVALFEGSSRSFDEVTESGESLTVVTEAELEGYRVRDLLHGMQIEYFGRVDTGEVIAVLSPLEDFRYEDFLVFFGPKERVAERPLINLFRARSGWTTAVFDLDGATAQAMYDYPDPPTLIVGDVTRPLESLPAGDFETFSYECLDARVPPELAPPDAGI
jgi:hypothetical protein